MCRRYASCTMCDLTKNKEHNIEKSYRLYLKMINENTNKKGEIKNETI